MERGQSLVEWARTTDFPQPVRWGEIEAAVLARPVPPGEIENLPEPPRVPWAVLGPLAAVLYGSSVIGLVAVLIGANAEPGAAELWFTIAAIAFLAAIVAALSPVLVSSSGARRGRWDLLVAGGTFVVALASYLLLQGAEADTGWTPWAALAATVAGLAAFVLLLVRRRSGHQLPRVRMQDLTPQERWYQGARAQVLEVLLERGLVDRSDVDTTGMVEMPIGSWGQLDVPGDPGLR